MDQEYLDKLKEYIEGNTAIGIEDRLEPAEMLLLRNAYEFFQGDLNTEDPIRSIVSNLSFVLVTVYTTRSKKSRERLGEGISLLEEATKPQELKK